MMRGYFNPLNFILLLFFGIVINACQSNNGDRTTASKAHIKNPNLVLIISDDQAWTDYGFTGHEVIETPHLDKLANESLTYTRGYVTAPLCSPSLASIITGLYPHQHGITGNDPFFEWEGSRWGPDWLQRRKPLFDSLLNHFKTLPLLTKILREEGYVTFQTGKWWLGSYEDGYFDYGMTHGDIQRGGRHGDAGLAIGREGMDTVAQFLDHVTETKDPFFLWYAPFLPHTPHNPPDSLLKKYLQHTDSEAMAAYWANCEWFDNTVGQLLDLLDDHGLTDNTVILYVCDNGWQQDPLDRNKYVTGSKQAPRDLGIRTPIMIKYPGMVKGEVDKTTLVSSIDLFPTVLDLIELDTNLNLPGTSLIKREELTARNTIFAEDFEHDIASLQQPVKSLEHRMIVQGDWKLIAANTKTKSSDSLLLYNISKDPFEKSNLVKEKPQIRQILLNELNGWWNP